MLKRSICLLHCFLLVIPLYAQDTIDKKLDAIFSKYNFTGAPGLSMGIVKNGKLIHYYRRGLANLTYDIPIQEETIFRVASIAKQFTAACIGTLVLNKKISLSDDVRKYIPELPVYGKVITVRHLLNHTSGIRNYNVLQQLRGFNDGFEGYTNHEVYQLLFQQKGINNIPGEKMLYSNSNYVLLALIVERVSGKSLNDFAVQSIFQPLEMKHTFYKSSNTEIIKNSAYAYYTNSKGYQQANSLNVCVGAGGLNSTVEDLAKWTCIFTAKESPFQALATFLTTRDTLQEGTLSSYARGVFVTDYKGYTTIHHSGMDTGLRTQLISIPEKNLSVILLANLENIHAVNLSYQVLDLFINAAPDLKKEEKMYSHKINELKKLTGDYQEINSDLTMRIRLQNDTLRANTNLGPYAVNLLAKGKNIFQRANNPSVTYKFNSNEDKEWDLAVDFAGAGFYFERVQLVDSQSVDVVDYTGEYHSEELGVTYRLFVDGNKLYVSFPYNPAIELKAGQKDEFGSGNRTRYIFRRGEKGQVINFSVASEGTVKDILFEKAGDTK